MGVEKVGKLIVRFVLAVSGILLALYFPSVVLGGFVFHRGVESVLLALQGVAILSVLLAIGFAYSSLSIRRLWAFVLAVLSLALVGSVLLATFANIVRIAPESPNILNTTGGLVGFVLIIYVLAYLLVYHIGYTNLRNWITI